ncbi:MAG: HesA/MoeB/ThiF family protein, partial [Halobacteriovoraceae bacterium]|nr:HesA/MoeB/ThiF family protein [Halobacteriovoraceae bacterium]
MKKLTPAEYQRYARHISLKEVGELGQQKLKDAKVLLIGAGGLGSPMALYLASAGIGTLGIVEFDRVDESNLQRQILHSSSEIGRPKIESALKRLSELNPYIEIVTHPVRLSSENARQIISNYDVVADGSDNFSTRYLTNDACYFEKKPLVSGAILSFEGQLS